MIHVRAFGLAAAFVASSFFAAAPQAKAAADTTMPACAASDSVVWENTKGGSKVYHLKGDKYFGTTKNGKYVCKSVADAAGYHAAGSKTSASSKAPNTPEPSAAASPDAMSSPAAMASGMPSKHKHKHHGSGASPSPSDAPSAAATAAPSASAT